MLNKELRDRGNLNLLQRKLYSYLRDGWTIKALDETELIPDDSEVLSVRKFLITCKNEKIEFTFEIIPTR